MPPVIAILRATATQHSSAAETCPYLAHPGVATALRPGRSRWDRSPLIYDARAHARPISPS